MRRAFVKILSTAAAGSIFLMGVLFSESADFESTPRFLLIKETSAKISTEDALSGKNSLVVNTEGSTEVWSEVFRTRPSFLKPGDYTFRFKYRFLSAAPESYLQCAIRPQKAPDGESDAVRRVNWVPEVGFGDVREARREFSIPEGQSDFAVILFAKNKLRVVIDEVHVEAGNSRRFVAAKDSLPGTGAVSIPKGPENFSIDPPKSAIKTLSVKDFGADPGSSDNTSAFRDAIAAARGEGVAVRLTVPKGVYRMTNDAPISFENLKDFEFEGNGSEFIFSKKKNDLFVVSNCERSRFENFFIDWDFEKDPVGNAATVSAVGEQGAYVDLRFSPRDKIPLPETPIRVMESLDPKTMTLGFEDSYEQGLQWRGGETLKREYPSPDTLRLFAPSGEVRSRFAARLQVGQVFRLRYYNYQMTAFRMIDNAHLTLSNAVIFSSPGHGFLTSGDQHHTQLLSCRIALRPDSGRVISTAGDHFHVDYSKGYWKLENCDFGFGGDDCVNIKDNIAFASWTSKDRLVIQNSRVIFHTGDEVELQKADFSPADANGGFVERTLDAKSLGNKTWELRFGKDIPDSLKGGMVIFNRRYDSGNIVIRNSYFHESPSRGLQIQSPNVLIEGNRFYKTHNSAMQFQAGYTIKSWSEGRGATNVVVRKNFIDHCNVWGGLDSTHEEMAAMIYMSVYLGDQMTPHLKSAFPVFKSYLFEDNEFIDCPGAAFFLSSAGDVTIRNNLFRDPDSRVVNHKFRSQILVSHSTNLQVVGNEWHASPYASRPGVEYDAETTGKIFIEGNRVKGVP